MIVGKLKDLNRYKGLNSNLDKAINYILETDLLTLEDGKNIIDGDNVFINKFSYVAEKESECFFEGHKNYLDIHIVLKGEEILGYNDLSELKQVSEYDADKDFIKFEGPVKAYVNSKPGDFIITFPEDIHMPKIAVNDNVVGKAVCKVLIEK